MRTIAFLNQKGGVGKTTTAANLAAALARRGLRIAAMDLDPQSHLTMHLGVEPGARTPGVYEVLTEEASLADAATSIDEHLSVVPACIDLAGAEIELVSTVGREQLLSDRLADVGDTWDYVIIDCPPSLGLLTLNALAAADEVIIPLQPHFLALQGFGKLLETVSLVRRRVNRRLRVGGVVLCMFESNTRLAAEVLQEVQGFLAASRGGDEPWSSARLYRTRIRRNVKLAECPSFGESIFTYAPGCAGAEDYAELAEEFVRYHDEQAEAIPLDEPQGEATKIDDEAENTGASEKAADAADVAGTAAEATPAQPAEAPVEEPNPAATDPDDDAPEATGEAPPASPCLEADAAQSAQCSDPRADCTSM